MNIAGSYRRKAKNSGDIDLLITQNDNKIPFGKSLKLIIKELKDLGIIKAVLANGKKKFMGLTKIKNYKHRHLDIIETTKEDYPFALLYFTGSGPFNVKMRKQALSLGYSLNEYNMTYKNTKDIVKDIKIKTEKDIFTLLKMDYKEPENRI